MTRWNASASYVRLPELATLVWVLSVPIPDKESWLDAFVLHPHRGISRLMPYPFGMGMVGAWTMHHFPHREASHIWLDGRELRKLPAVVCCAE